MSDTDKLLREIRGLLLGIAFALALFGVVGAFALWDILSALPYLIEAQAP